MKKGLLAGLGLVVLLASAAPLSAAAPVLGAPRGHRFHGGHRWRFGFGWGWYSPGFYHPYGYYPYGYGPYGYGYGRGYGVERDWAVVDTDISPEDARVYLDGKYIGLADDFDGFPDDLYLRRGRYRLEFRLEGYETRSVDIDARPGRKLDLQESLRRVPGAKQYGSYDVPDLPGGVRRFWGKRQNRTESWDGDERGNRDRRDDRMRDYPSEDRPSDRDADDGDWRDQRDRSDDSRVAPGDDDADGSAPGVAPRDNDADEPAVAPRDDDADESRVAPRDDGWRRPDGDADRTEVRADGRSGRTRLRFKIEPSDAAVYLDDRFVGTGEEVGSVSAGVAIKPGKHKVTVSRPGFRDRTVEIDVASGGSETVEVELER